jgi:hypothetical protein
LIACSLFSKNNQEDQMHAILLQFMRQKKMGLKFFSPSIEHENQQTDEPSSTAGFSFTNHVNPFARKLNKKTETAILSISPHTVLGSVVTHGFTS